MNYIKLSSPLHILLVALFVCLGCESTQETRTVDPPPLLLHPDLPTLQDMEPKHYRGLEQVVAYHKGVFSGSKPQGQEGLDSLHRLGIRTIICVDGAVPNVEGASQLGMRYIHLPIKYDAPDRARIIELVVALEIGIQAGPTYIHCHHGKHRSATATAIALIGLGYADSKSMLARLAVSGTSKRYEGLWAAVAQAQYIGASTRNAISHDLPSSVQPTGIVESMLAAESTIANLKLIKKSGWSVPESHPDLVPAAEAGALSEIFRHLLGDITIKKYPKTFHLNLQNSWIAAQTLEEAILSEDTNHEALTSALSVVTQACTHCHHAFRK